MSKITNNELRVENIKSKGYGISPKLILQDMRLSVESKAIYTYFSSYCGNGVNYAFPKLDTILYHLKISKNRYYKHLKPLVQLGFIEVVQRRKKNDNGKWVSDSNLYILNEFIDESLCVSESSRSVENSRVSDIPSFEDLQSKDVNNRNSFNKNISMYVGLYKKHFITTSSIEKFISNLDNKISFDLFERVVVETLNNSKIIKKDVYIIKTIKALIENNIRNVDEYEMSIENHKGYLKSLTKSKKTDNAYNIDGCNNKGNLNKEFKKTKFHNFTETFTNYSDEEFEDIILKSQKAKFSY